MGQFSKVFVKIIDGVFRPMGFPIGYVWQVNDVIAQYVTKGGYAVLCDEAGDEITPPWNPTVQSGEADTTTVTLTYDQTMAVTDSTGITVTVDGVAATISLVAAATNTIVITLSATVDVGTNVTVDYDASTNNITNDIGVSAPYLNNYFCSNVTA